MEELLNKYHDYLKYELNYSENTISDYFFHLNKYFAYLKEKNLLFDSITKDDIIDFLKYLDSKKYSNKTISNILSSLRNFYDFLLDEKKVEFNIFKLVKNPKLEKKLPNFLSYENMRTIFDTIEVKDFQTARNKMIIELLYATGVRVSELCNIKVQDIDFNNRSIKVLGKGQKERIVYFGVPCLKAINVYKSYNNFSSEYLILNKEGNKISVRSIQKIVDKICDEACINSNVTPHTFRHTFATHLLNNGADIKSVGELLGHNSLNTTEIYTHITSDFLKSEYLKNMPRK